MGSAGQFHAAPMGLRTLLLGCLYYKHVAPTELGAAPNARDEARRAKGVSHAKGLESRRRLQHARCSSLHRSVHNVQVLTSDTSEAW